MFIFFSQFLLVTCILSCVIFFFEGHVRIAMIKPLVIALSLRKSQMLRSMLSWGYQMHLVKKMLMKTVKIIRS